MDAADIHARLESLKHLGGSYAPELSHLAAPNDTSILDSGFVARQNRYWGDLKQLRTDKAALEAKLAAALFKCATAETERDAALDRAREARNALAQLKQDIAREKATTERLTALSKRNSSETAEERTERERDERFRAAHRERYFSGL